MSIENEIQSLTLAVKELTQAMLASRTAEPVKVVAPAPEPVKVVAPAPEPVKVVAPAPEPVKVVAPAPEPVKVAPPSRDAIRDLARSIMAKAGGRDIVKAALAAVGEGLSISTAPEESLQALHTALSAHK